MHGRGRGRRREEKGRKRERERTRFTTFTQRRYCILVTSLYSLAGDLKVLVKLQREVGAHVRDWQCVSKVNWVSQSHTQSHNYQTQPM